MRSKKVGKKPKKTKRRASHSSSLRRTNSNVKNATSYDSETCSIGTEEDRALNNSSCSAFSFTNDPPKIVSSPSDLKHALGELTLALKDSISGAITSVDETIDTALDKKEGNSMVTSILVIGERVDDLFCQSSSPTTKDSRNSDRATGPPKQGRKSRGRSREPRTKGPILYTTLSTNDDGQEEQIYHSYQRRLV